MCAMHKQNEGARAPSKRLKNDIFLIAVLLLAALLLGAFLMLLQQPGDTVRVSVNGVLYGTYPLHVDTVVEIGTEAGYNRLMIKGGQAYIEAADCPDGICAAHRPIDGTHESITCLPHGVVITVVCVGDSDAPDVVV